MKKINIIAAFTLIFGLVFFPFESFAACVLDNAPANTVRCPICVKNSITSENTYYIIYSIMCRIEFFLTDAVLTIYTNVAIAGANIVSIFATFYVIFYGSAFMFGLAQANYAEFLIRLLKLLFVVLIATNATFFNDNLLSFFMSALNALPQYALPAQGPTSSLSADPTLTIAQISSTIYGRLDTIFWQLIGIEQIMLLIIMIIAFLLTGPGLVISILLMMGGGSIFYALLKLFIGFGVSVIIVQFMLMFAGVFFIMLLFDQTRDLFYNWLSLLISYTMQPMFFLFFLVIISNVLDVRGAFTPLFGTTDVKAVATMQEIDACTTPNFRSSNPLFRPGGILENSVIFPKCYSQNFLGLGHSISLYEFRPGTDILWDTLSFTIVQDDPTVPGNTSVQVTMPILLGVATGVLIWIIGAWVTIDFVKKVPELAMRLSTVSSFGRDVRGGVIGGTGDVAASIFDFSGGVDREGRATRPISSGIIMPFVSEGAGKEVGDSVKRGAFGAANAVGGFIRGAGTGAVKRAFRPFMRKSEIKERAEELGSVGTSSTKSTKPGKNTGKVKR